MIKVEPGISPSEFSLWEEVRTLARMSAPVSAGQVGLMAMGVTDLLMVGPLGEGALASLAMGNIWSFGVLIFGIGALTGLDPVFSQAFGAGDRLALARSLSRACVLGLILSVPILGAHLVASDVLTAMGQPAAIVPIAAQYCDALAWGIPSTLLFVACRQFLQGMGKMAPATWVILGANLLNILCNWLFIYGHWGFEAMGVEGAGWATTCVRWMMPIGLLLISHRTFRRYLVEWRRGMDARAIGRLLWLGGPVGVQISLEVWAFGLSGIMMGWLGANALAGHSIALNLSGVIFMIPFGLGSAAATRIGNRLGAGKPWARSGWTSVGLGACIMLMSALLFFLFPEPLAQLYTRDAAVLTAAVSLLPIAAAFQLFDGLQVVAQGVLRGGGDTRFPALANLLGFYGVGLPVGAMLAFRWGYGAQGVWWGLVVGLGVVAGILLLRLRSVARKGGRLVATELE